MLAAFRGRWITYCLTLAVAGCAASAPDDIWESLDQQWLRDTPYGIVRSVAMVNWDGKFYGHAGIETNLQQMGRAIMAEKRYVHEILLSGGEVVKETSVYRFPMGACVSLGANQTRHPGRMAFSRRCSAASGGK